MTDRDAFLAAIHAAPADDAPRLVYSDWLEENGEPERAEFIRIQLAMWREYQAHRRCTPRLDALYLQQKALFTRPWADVLRRCGAAAIATYSRGFSTAAFSLPAATFAAEAAELAGWFGPNTHVDLNHCAGALAAVAARPELRWVHALRIREEWRHSELTDLDVRPLIRSPHLGQLRGLALEGPGQGEKGLSSRTCRALAAAPSLTGLHALNLAGNPIGDLGLKALAGAEGLRSLRTLILDNTGLTTAAVEDLATSPVFARLEHLSVMGTVFTPASWARLTARFGPALHRPSRPTHPFREAGGG